MRPRCQYPMRTMIVDLALLLLAVFCVGVLFLRHLPPPAAPPKGPIGFH